MCQYTIKSILVICVSTSYWCSADVLMSYGLFILCLRSPQLRVIVIIFSIIIIIIYCKYVIVNTTITIYTRF